MKKDPSVNIISFRMVERRKTLGGIKTHTYGLGDDNRMYFWDYDSGTWYCYWDATEAGMDKVTENFL